MIKAICYLMVFLWVLPFLSLSCSGKEMVVLRSEDADIYYSSGLAFLERNQLDLALREFQKALEINPEHLEALNDSGIVNLQKGELDQAAAKFKRVIALKPDLPIPHRNLGSIYLHKKMTDEAVNEFKQAVKLSPREYYSHYLLGKAFMEKGLEELGILEFQEAVQLKPDFTEARKDLAFIYHRRGHENYREAYFKAAIKEIKAALSASPSDMESHQLLGELYLDTGAYPMAIFEFKEVLRVNPERVNLHKELAFALAASNYFDQAIESLHIYRGLFVESSEVYRDLGHIYHMLKEDHLATAMYNRALEFDSRSEAAWWLYLTLLRSNRKEEALGVLERYARGLKKTNWQAGLARYLMVNQKAGEFVLPEEKEEGRGLAFFFLSSYYLISGQKSLAREYLTTSVATRFYNSWEYIAALKALEDLDKAR